MTRVGLILLAGLAGLAFTLWWINKGPPDDPDDPGSPSDYGADGP
jgi:hypothetical protein